MLWPSRQLQTMRRVEASITFREALLVITDVVRNGQSPAFAIQSINRMIATHRSADLDILIFLLFVVLFCCHESTI